MGNSCAKPGEQDAGEVYKKTSKTSKIEKSKKSGQVKSGWTWKKNRHKKNSVSGKDKLRTKVKSIEALTSHHLYDTPGNKRPIVKSPVVTIGQQILETHKQIINNTTRCNNISLEEIDLDDKNDVMQKQLSINVDDKTESSGNTEVKLQDDDVSEKDKKHENSNTESDLSEDKSEACNETEIKEDEIDSNELLNDKETLQTILETSQDIENKNDYSLSGISCSNKNDELISSSEQTSSMDKNIRVEHDILRHTTALADYFNTDYQETTPASPNFIDKINNTNNNEVFYYETQLDEKLNSKYFQEIINSPLEEDLDIETSFKLAKNVNESGQPQILQNTVRISEKFEETREVSESEIVSSSEKKYHEVRETVKREDEHSVNSEEVKESITIERREKGHLEKQNISSLRLSYLNELLLSNEGNCENDNLLRLQKEKNEVTEKVEKVDLESQHEEDADQSESNSEKSESESDVSSSHEQNVASNVDLVEDNDIAHVVITADETDEENSESVEKYNSLDGIQEEDTDIAQIATIKTEEQISERVEKYKSQREEGRQDDDIEIAQVLKSATQSDEENKSIESVEKSSSPDENGKQIEDKSQSDSEESSDDEQLHNNNEICDDVEVTSTLQVLQENSTEEFQCRTSSEIIQETILSEFQESTSEVTCEEILQISTENIKIIAENSVDIESSEESSVEYINTSDEDEVVIHDVNLSESHLNEQEKLQVSTEMSENISHQEENNKIEDTFSSKEEHDEIQAISEDINNKELQVQNIPEITENVESNTNIDSSESLMQNDYEIHTNYTETNIEHQNIVHEFSETSETFVHAVEHRKLQDTFTPEIVQPADVVSTPQTSEVKIVSAVLKNEIQNQTFTETLNNFTELKNIKVGSEISSDKKSYAAVLGKNLAWVETSKSSVAAVSNVQTTSLTSHQVCTQVQEISASSKSEENIESFTRTETEHKIRQEESTINDSSDEENEVSSQESSDNEKNSSKQNEIPELITGSLDSSKNDKYLLPVTSDPLSIKTVEQETSVNEDNNEKSSQLTICFETESTSNVTNVIVRETTESVRSVEVQERVTESPVLLTPVSGRKSYAEALRSNITKK